MSPLSLFPAQKSADMDGPYRYRLERRWASGRPFVVIGCNPSKANADEDDPTIRRCLGFASTHACGALIMVNVFAWRSTDVRGLSKLSQKMAIGPRNYIAISEACRLQSALVVCAWGSKAKLTQELRYAPLQLAVQLHRSGVELHVLRLTKNGDPEHPLYLPAELSAWRWDPTGANDAR